MPVGQNERSHFLPFAQHVAEHTRAASAGGQMLLAPAAQREGRSPNERLYVMYWDYMDILCMWIMWILYCLLECVYIYTYIHIYIVECVYIYIYRYIVYIYALLVSNDGMTILFYVKIRTQLRPTDSIQTDRFRSKGSLMFLEGSSPLRVTQHSYGQLLV